jgi:uncharacterized protein (TIGR04255 family)
LQLQADRFHFNWRKRPGVDYPRYRSTSQEFARHWESFHQFVADESVPSPQLIQAELTYVNQVVLDEPWISGDTEAVFEWLRPLNEAIESQPELEVALHYDLAEVNGRLHVTVRTGRGREGNKRVAAMELTARGTLGEHSLLEWYAHARAAIVRSFAALTSSTAHTHWGRTL